MKIANDRLNLQVLVLEDAETEIRKAVIDGFLRREFKEVTARKVKKIIEKAVAKIKIPSLKESARRSLTAFADKQYDTLRAGLGGTIEIVAAVIALRGSPAARKKRTEDFVADLLQKNRNMPVPRGLQPDHYVKTVIERMDAVFNELVEQAALDPDDVSGRNSLRNKAEMEVRYQRHQDEIADMKAKGGLWICSVHADCSDRCARYQGRVYSMDGTSGVTEDGREYVPLKDATQNPDDRYTTKAGRTYQNGLFGFNCRHYLVPYKPKMAVPTVTEEEQQKEYEITKTQREYERRIRREKIKAVTYEKENPRKATAARKLAREITAEYERYSRRNNRAFYPKRTQII